MTGTLGGYSKTVNGTIIVQPAAPKLTASSNVEQEVQLNHAISTITITSDTAVSFSISCLPAGVVAIAGADSTRLIITGKATMLETTSFSVVAKAHGKGKQSNSISGQITVTEDAVAAAPVLTPSASSISVDKGVAITDLVITSDVAAAWAIDKALPAGLTGTASADGLTYTISGTPTAVSASSVYTISATANELTTEQPITITVNAVAPVVTAPSNATQNVALGEAIGNISFSSSDAGAVFSVEGLPAGLTAVQNGSTYTISGTATAAGEFTYTVTATVDGLSDSKTGKITVNEPVTYSVTFKDYDGTVLKQQTGILAGGFATAPATPTRTGYTFAGWDKSYSNVTEDLIVTATYTINTYTVKFFDKDNNQIGATQTVNYGGNATAPTAPAVTGYTFSGWDKSYSNVTEDLIVTATYTINTYTVTFKNWNGDVLSTQTVDYGAGATEPTVPAREGYEFIGWDKDNFYVTQGRKGVAVIPWKVLDLNNTGLKDPTSGSVLNIHVSPQDPIVKLRLVSGFIIVDKFQNVLATILTHIKQNLEANGELPKKGETSSEKDVSEAASKPPVSEAAVENAASTSVEENEAAKLSTDVSQSEGLSATKETESNAPAVEAVEKEAESH